MVPLKRIGIVSQIIFYEECTSRSTNQVSRGESTNLFSFFFAIIVDRIECLTAVCRCTDAMPTGRDFGNFSIPYVVSREPTMQASYVS